MELPAAWTLDERVAGMEAGLEAAEEDSLWFVVSEVSASPAPPLRSALAADLAEGRPTLPATWNWFLEDLGRLAPLRAFEAAVPPEWEIRGRHLVRGGALLRLERRRPAQRLPE